MKDFKRMKETTTYATTEVRFKHLSTPLKIAVIASWIIGGIYVLAFIVGFFVGVMS